MTSSTQGVGTERPWRVCDKVNATGHVKICGAGPSGLIATVGNGECAPEKFAARAELIVAAVNSYVPSPDSKEAYRKALKSASDQCGNVIFNCEQRPADNDRHLQSWCGVKEYIDAVLSATPKQPE